MKFALSFLGALLLTQAVDAACTNTLVHKEFRDLTDAERTAFMNVLTKLYATSEWTKLTQIHEQYKAMSHNEPAFLPWHRGFMIYFQNLVHTVDASVTVPYFDFSIDSQAPWKSVIWDFFGSSKENGCVPDGPFAGPNKVQYPTPHCLIRGFNPSGAGMSTLTTTEALGQLTRNSKDYTTFEEGLQYGYHAVLHNTVGGVSGDMAQMYSPNDPIFFMHHMFVDKLWHDWTQSHAQATYLPTNERNQKMMPLGLTIQDLEHVENNCYTYAQPAGGVIKKPAVSTPATNKPAVSTPATNSDTAAAGVSSQTTSPAVITSALSSAPPSASAITTNTPAVTSVPPKMVTSSSTFTTVIAGTTITSSTTSIGPSTAGASITQPATATATANANANAIAGTVPVTNTNPAASTTTGLNDMNSGSGDDESSDSSAPDVVGSNTGGSTAPTTGGDSATLDLSSYLSYLMGLRDKTYGSKLGFHDAASIGSVLAEINGKTYNATLKLPVLPAPLSERAIKQMMYDRTKVKATEKTMAGIVASCAQAIHAGKFVPGPGASTTPGLPGTGSGRKAFGSLFSPYPPTSKSLLLKNDTAPASAWKVSSLLKGLDNISPSMSSGASSTWATGFVAILSTLIMISI